MKNKNFILMIFIVFLSAITELGLSSSSVKLDKKPTSEIRLLIDSSLYLMDKNLIDSGYKLKEEKNKLILLYKNKEIPNSEFYSLFIGPNEAKKLFLTIKSPFKKPEIYLNDKKKIWRINSSGIIEKDLYLKKGNYILTVVGNKNEKKLTYFFLLDANIRLHCEGKDELRCKKEPYEKLH